MCALGAPHSSNAEIRAKNQVLARSAQELIISHCLTTPSPTTIQALLCLAFHEVGQGNASQGWLFSGMAFRMGQDIGFHQDPTRWILQDRSIVTPEDIEIRRRIYWGSYVADKYGLHFLALDLPNGDFQQKYCQDQNTDSVWHFPCRHLRSSGLGAPWFCHPANLLRFPN